MSQVKHEFETIRKEIRDVIVRHGGKIEIREWTAADGDVLKVEMTFKNYSPLGIPANTTESRFAIVK